MLLGGGGDDPLIIACVWLCEQSRGEESGGESCGESCVGNNIAHGRWCGFHLSSRLEQSEFTKHGNGEISGIDKTFGARDGQRPLCGHFGKEFSAGTKSLRGANGGGAADAEIPHSQRAAADERFFGAIKNPLRLGRMIEDHNIGSQTSGALERSEGIADFVQAEFKIDDVGGDGDFFEFAVKKFNRSRRRADREFLLEFAKGGKILVHGDEFFHRDRRIEKLAVASADEKNYFAGEVVEPGEAFCKQRVVGGQSRVLSAANFICAGGT